MFILLFWKGPAKESYIKVAEKASGGHSRPDTPVKNDSKATVGDKWCEKSDIHEFPTNAFGLMDFINEDEG